MKSTAHLGPSEHSACVDVFIQRPWVEAGDLTPALARLNPLLASPDTVRGYRGRLHLFFEGYDTDPRELWMISEVRTYMRALDLQFPYCLWFMAPTDPTLFLLVACCCEVATYGFRGDTVSATVYPAALAPFLSTHFLAIERLANQFTIPETEFSPVVQAVLALFGVPGALRRQAAPSN